MVIYKVDKKVSEELDRYIEDNFIECEIDNLLEFEVNNYAMSVNYEFPNLSELTKNGEETFQETVFKYIDQRGYKDPDVYKRGGISKQTFSRIRCDVNYQPKKDTAIQICIGLRLNIDESNDLLNKAGYSLSKAIKRDVAIKYFLENRKHDIDYINTYLYEKKLPLIKIGC